MTAGRIDREPSERSTVPDLTQYDVGFLLGLYRRMVLIRRFEERVKYLFLEGIMPGTIHQCHGQEACAVGVCAALRADDVITSTHRPHGHALAKGVPVDAAMAELFGRITGCCKGKGGSRSSGGAFPWRPARLWPSSCAGSRAWLCASWATEPPTKELFTKASIWGRSGNSRLST